MTSADEPLWQRVLANDSLAYAELFDRHSDRVYRRALAMLGNTHDAEDVTAAAFFELWRKHRSVRLVGGSVLPWLLVTAVNLGRNHVRGTARYRAAISAIPRSEPSGDPAVVIEHRLDASAALAGLSRIDAALLVLTAVEGMTTAEAAEAVGLRPGAARMRLSRLRDHGHLEFRVATEGELS